MFASEYFSDVKINNSSNDKLIDLIWDILARPLFGKGIFAAMGI